MDSSIPGKKSLSLKLKKSRKPPPEAPSVPFEPSPTKSLTPQKQTQLTWYVRGKDGSPLKAANSPNEISRREEPPESGKREVFSTKIKRRPNKFFNKEELPPSLKSASVSPSPRKRTPHKRKASSDLEVTPSPKQKTIDKFFSSDQATSIRKVLNFDNGDRECEVIVINDSEEYEPDRGEGNSNTTSRLGSSVSDRQLKPSTSTSRLESSVSDSQLKPSISTSHVEPSTSANRMEPSVDSSDCSTGRVPLHNGTSLAGPSAQPQQPKSPQLVNGQNNSTNAINPTLVTNETEFLASCATDWEDFPEEVAPQEVAPPLNENTNQTEGPERTPKKARQPTEKRSPFKVKKFESFIYYLIKNPISERAIEIDSVLPLEFCANVFKGFLPLEDRCQLLYARMYARTRTWYRLSDLDERYRESCGDVEGLIQVLISIGFITEDCHIEDLNTLLNLLQVAELKKLCKLFKVKDTGKKETLIKSLSEVGKNQKALFHTNNVQNIKTRSVELLGKCVKLTEGPKKFFGLLLVLTTYPYYQGKESDRLTDLINRLNLLKFRKVIYPNYECRVHPVFKTYQELSDYWEALQIGDEIATAIENKDWALASDKVLEVKVIFSNYIKNEENIRLLNSKRSYLLKFTAGQQYCYSLSQGVTVLKKDNSTLEKAVECLEMLLEQKYFILGKRGSWYEELALIYQSRLKDLTKACRTVIAGLSDPKMSPIGKMTLSQRGETLLHRKKSGIPDGMKLELRRVIDEVCCGKFTPKEETIVGRQTISGASGKKHMFYVETETEKINMSVEETVIHHFRHVADCPFQKGLHDEGKFLMNLILASFFDIIYSQPLEDESFFHSPMQIKPLDWSSKLFYVHRKPLIEARLNDLRMRRIPGLIEDLVKIVGMNITCLVNWSYLEDLSSVRDVLDCLGLEVFLNIAEHVIKDYKTYHSGFPDLMLWDPPSGRCLFAEVKGPGDQLSYSQRVWLKHLEHFGASAIVVHVECLGTTVKRPKS